MPIQFPCSQCQKKMRAPDGTEGKKARCPACSAITLIPSVAVASAVPAARVASPPPAPATAPPPVSDNPFATPATTDFSGSMNRRPRSGRFRPDWENEQSLGSFFRSTKDILLSPAETFRDLRRDGPLGPALAFAAISAAFLGAIIGFLQAIFIAIAQGDAVVAIGIVVGIVLTVAILYPIFAVIGCFVGGGFLHLLLSLVGAKKYSYNATVRSVAYMQMSSWPFMLVPVLGPLVGGIWILVVQIIGLAEVHETTKGRVALAIFMPVIILMFVGVLVGVFLPLIG